jgi:hypothetical protein
MYFALDADPALEGGLAPATFAGYQATANPHLLGRLMHNNKHEVRAQELRDVARPHLSSTNRTPSGSTGT